MNYFKRKFGNHFERPYGWAWLLKLQAELEKNAQVNLTMITTTQENLTMITTTQENLMNMAVQ